MLRDYIQILVAVVAMAALYNFVPQQLEKIQRSSVAAVHDARVDEARQ